MESHGVEQTLLLGQRLGQSLTPGTAIALIGTLGSGKTHLVKGIAQGNDAPAGLIVNSPTFVLVNEYSGRVPIYHVDAYRLNDATQLEAIGFDEMLAGEAAVLLEWADRVPQCIPDGHLRIEITVKSDTSRRFKLIASDSKHADLLAAASNAR